jgi:hypothetical protein
MRKIAQFGKYIRSLAIPPWTSFTVQVYFKKSHFKEVYIILILFISLKKLKRAHEIILLSVSVHLSVCPTAFLGS